MIFPEILNPRLSPGGDQSEYPSRLRGDASIADTADRRLASHGSWKSALVAALAASAQPGLIALIGPRGSGKSALLRVIGRELAAFGSITRAWCPDDASIVDDCDVLLIDDAECCPPSMLRRLARGRQICFAAGTQELSEQLDPRAGRLTIIEIEPVDLAHTRAFVEGHLRALGQAPDMVTEAGLLALHQDVGGAPGAMLDIAGLAVFLARLEGADQVGIGHIVAASRSSQEVGSSEQTHRPATPAAIESPVPNAEVVTPVSPRERVALGRILLPVLVLVCSAITLQSAVLPVSVSREAAKLPVNPTLSDAIELNEGALDPLFANPAVSGSFILASQGVPSKQQLGIHR